MTYLDYYIDNSTNRIQYSKDISLTQYSTTYVVRLLTKIPYYVVNMNITTGSGINTYKKNLILSTSKTPDGYYAYTCSLGLDVTGYEFKGDKSILRLAFYIYPEKNNLDKVFASSICYLPLLRSVDDMPSDGSITQSELSVIQGTLNDLAQKINDSSIGITDTAKNYDTTNGTIKDKFDELDTSIGNTNKAVSSLSARVNSIEDYKPSIDKNSGDISTLKTEVATNKTNITSLQNAIKNISSAGVKWKIVSVLPSRGESGTVYLILNGSSSENNVYTEYMWINDAWEIIGSTNTASIDLSNYYTKSQSDAKYALSSAIPTKVSQLQNDSGYLTQHQSLAEYATVSALNTVKNSIPTKVSQLSNDSDYTTTSYVTTVKNNLQNQIDSHTDRLSTYDEAISHADEIANQALVLAKNKTTKVYDTFSDMIKALKENVPGIVVGTDIFLKETDVPDFWVSSVLSSNNGKLTYKGTTYSGLWYTLEPIEGKTDLSDYYNVSYIDTNLATKSELANALSGVEKTSRKVTAINDTTLNNSNYPSTLAVKNYVSSIKSSIENNIDDTYATKASLSSSVDTINTSISNMDRAYKEADNALQGNIDRLDTGLATEITNRQNADKSLKSRLDTLETSVGDGGDIDTRISKAVSAEAKLRQDADNNLNTKISTEVTNRTNDIKTVNASITNLESSYKSADNALQDNIDSVSSDVTKEVTRAKAAEKTLQDNINTASSNLSNEISRAEGAEATLQSNINDTNATVNALTLTVASNLATAKSYTDTKTSRSNLVSVIGEASTTLNGLLSVNDKKHLDALYAVLGNTEDEDTFINTINEVLAIFSKYPEGTDIVSWLNDKVNISDIIDNLTSSEISKPLSANQGKVLKGLIDTEISDRSTAISDLDTAYKAADAALQSNIDTVSSGLSNEISRAQKAETDEATARSSADETLQSNIDTVSSNLSTEVNDRKKLATTVSGIDTAYKAADTRLQTNINTVSSNLSSEVTARSSADTTLQNNIDTVSSNLSNEISRANEAETDLGDRITAETNNRVSDIATVNAAISTEISNRQALESTLNTSIANRVVCTIKQWESE